MPPIKDKEHRTTSGIFILLKMTVAVDNVHSAKSESHFTYNSYILQYKFKLFYFCVCKDLVRVKYINKKCKNKSVG